MADYPSATFLSIEGYHHHIGASTWHSAGATSAPESAARLVQFEVHLPDAAEAERVVQRAQAAGVTVDSQEEGWRLPDPS